MSGQDLNSHTVVSQLVAGHNNSTEGKCGQRGTSGINEGCCDDGEGKKKMRKQKNRSGKKRSN